MTLVVGETFRALGSPACTRCGMTNTYGIHVVGAGVYLCGKCLNAPDIRKPHRITGGDQA